MTEPFLSRWSRRKLDTKVQPAPLPPDEARASGEAGVPAPAEPPPDLPPVETLDKDSDYSAFLKAGVPQELKQAALQKLWASDPALMAPEVMDLHMGDYTSPVAEVVKTAWRLGKGVLDAAELAAEAEEKAASEPPSAPPKQDS
ncbi:DUF3306 domain-containing protein [Paramagnetospirillum magneticum]|uniref:DUF3306 domain-containing protein n=1 Tax=Paramagnetospirillum magneticum (strain ATCC 700264 / AMB-1) TaxID=342108 RepID=Q2W3V3_PARM1|nr:DUF3306 domain-containing protein [Paramagnetospirillum magneticum]BAE51472.1 hypothetical protein amb2668 [Paramagnetospirillum magneticum AMB-1]